MKKGVHGEGNYEATRDYNKRTKEYLESIEGVPRFVSARVQLLGAAFTAEGKELAALANSGKEAAVSFWSVDKLAGQSAAK